jgi:predicted dehydrogenase
MNRMTKIGPGATVQTVVILGAGRMGRRHIHVAAGLGLPLTGIADLHADALALAQQEGSGTAQLSQDPIALLERTRPECVIIATTAPSHAELTCAAAENGARYILCEKPMAESIRECRRMIRVCREHGAALAINHQLPFMEQHRFAGEAIRSEAFGGFRGMTVVSGNFGMAMNGTHYFELFRQMAGEPPDSVTAWFSDTEVPNPRGPQFRDAAGAVRVTTAGQKRLYIDSGADQGYGIQTIYAGRCGVLNMDELGGVARLSVRAAADRSLPTTRYATPAELSIREFTVDNISSSRALLDAVLNGRSYPSGEAGLLAVQTLVAAYVSNENGHGAVRIADALPEDRVFAWA